MNKTPEKAEPLSIKNIVPLLKLNFDEDDIKRISKSIKDIGYEPLIVRPKDNGKYQLCSHLEIFEALKQLRTDKINVIVRDITEQQGKELALASLLSHPDISSEDQELLVWTVRNSGNYKSDAELGRKIGKSDSYVSDRCYGKVSREEIFGPEGRSDHISTDTLRRIRTLSSPERRKFCDRVKDGKFKPGDAPEIVQFLKSDFLSDKIKEMVLDGEINWRKAKTFNENRVPVIKELKKAISLYNKKETIQKIIEDEKPHYSSEPFRLLASFINTINKIFIKNIGDKNKIKQVIRDLRISGTQIFQVLYELKVINKKEYQSICKISKIPHELIKQLRDDGHYYFFPDEWLTPTEKKLKERLDKLLDGKDEPALR